jgi:glycerophosphoryl diester phosphodiesterase
MSKSIKFCSVFIFISLISFSTIAQPVLSNHTFSKENNQVGILSLPGWEAKFRLSGANAGLFRLKANKLYLLKGSIKPDIKWYDLTIAAETKSGSFQQTFRLVKDEFIRNSVIAHRGAWKNTGVTENSIAALQQAIRLGCQGSEFDVHMTVDSVLVINHDPTIQGQTIHTSTSAQLLALKLPSGENMPSLESFLKAGMTQNNTKLILEIKPTINKERALQLTKKVVDVVKKLKAQAWIDYISFDYEICMELMRLDPHARVAYLNGDKSPEMLAADKLWGLDYNQSVYQKNPDWIAQAKQKGLTINVWTVNNPALLKSFIDQKIDFITTNEPELLLKMINK